MRMSASTRQSEDVPAPNTFPNPRNDDPWDNDAVQWLLLKLGGSNWTRGTLFEALRRQPRLVQDHPDVVAEAARLAARFGVQQKEISRGRGTITRLIRTDAAAPRYPADRLN